MGLNEYKGFISNGEEISLSSVISAVASASEIINDNLSSGYDGSNG